MEEADAHLNDELRFEEITVLQQRFSGPEQAFFGIFFPLPIIVADSTVGETLPETIEVPDWRIYSGLVG